MKLTRELMSKLLFRRDFKGREWLLHRLPETTGMVNYEGYELELDTSRSWVEKTIYYTGFYENKLVDFIKKQLPAGGVFVDVGANIGCHTLVASKIASKVIAFEPNPYIREILRKTIERNNIKNIFVYGVALSDYEGKADFYYNEQNGTLKPGSGWAPKKVTVPVSTLDTFLRNEPRVDFIKTDCEGYDFNVLIGGRETIKEFKPIVIFENSEGQIARL